jgi:P-type conjugative transfer protein TrbJ
MKIFLQICVLSGVIFTFVNSRSGGIPVFDGLNLQQNLVSAMEAVESTANQITQIENMVARYENMVKNTLAPATYLWEKATETLSTLQGAYDKVQGYADTLQNLDDYMSKFKDVNYYSNSPCFRKGGCSAEELQAIEDVQLIATQSEKDASDAMMRNVKVQMDLLEKDAEEIQKLQDSAQDADGYMKAMAAANQFSAKLNAQAVLMRSMMATMMYSMATEQQARVQKESLQKANFDKRRIDNITTTPGKRYSGALY